MILSLYNRNWINSLLDILFHLYYWEKIRWGRNWSGRVGEEQSCEWCCSRVMAFCCLRVVCLYSMWHFKISMGAPHLLITKWGSSCLWKVCFAAAGLTAGSGMPAQTGNVQVWSSWKYSEKHVSFTAIAICVEEMRNELGKGPVSSSDALLACWFGVGLGIFCLFLKFFSLKLYQISLLAEGCPNFWQREHPLEHVTTWDIIPWVWCFNSK